MPKVLPPPVKLVWEMTIKELPLVTFDLSSVRFDFIQNRFDVEMYESPTNNSVRPVFHRLIQGLPGNFNLPTSVTVTFVMKDDAGKVINETIFLNCYAKKYDIDYDSMLIKPTIHKVEFIYSHYSMSRYPHGREEFFDPYAAYDRAMGIIK